MPIRPATAPDKTIVFTPIAFGLTPADRDDLIERVRTEVQNLLQQGSLWT